MIKTFHNCRKLVTECRRLSADVDAVSFDIFDTVLVRRVHDPDLLKMPVARFLAARTARAGIAGWNAGRVWRFRNRVEAMHRRRAGRTGPDQEARYPDFMGDVLARIFRDRPAEEAQDLLRAVTDYELELESAMLVPRAGIRRLLELLKARGKRIYLISDMYLPSTHLQRLIERAGLAPLVDGISSSADTLCAKASGAAWPLLKEHWKLDPARWLHVGDNPISDGMRPSKFGLRALVLRDADELTRKAIVRRYAEIAVRRPFWRGRLVQQLTLPLEDENQPRHPLYVTGHNFFAPFFCAFVQRVAEQCRARSIRRVYFFSREGQLLLKIWERLAPALFPAGDQPAAHYLYVSRMALAGPACAVRGMDEENAAIAFLPAGSRDFRDLCRVFGLQPEPFEPHLRRKRLRLDSVLSRFHAGWDPGDGERFKLVLADHEFQAEIRRQTAAPAQALQAYLAGEHFFDQPDVALVDIGWLGTIQRFLHQAVAHRPDHPRCHGFVMALAGNFPFPSAPDNRIEGYVFDRTKFDFAGSLIMYARDLFEEVSRAPHPGLMAYRNVGPGGYEPQFRQEDDIYARNESRQSAYYAPLREGILDAAARHVAAVTVLGYTSADLKPWLNSLLVSRLAFPRTSEVKFLRQVHHLDDFTGRHPPLKRYRKAQNSLWNSSPARLRLVPFLRLFEYVKHAIMMLRQ